MSTYRLDSPVQFTCTFTGGPPSTVALVLKDPTDTIHRYTGAQLSSPTADSRRAVVALNKSGTWIGVWTASGPGATDVWRTDESEIIVVGNEALR